jgi:solute:Na+ symporter, SSS family
MQIHEVLTPLDYVVIGIYLLGIISLGFWISLRKGSSTDIFLAGRNLGWGSIGLSIFGTNVAPSMLIASASVAYAHGMVPSTFEWLAWPFLLMLAVIFLPHYLATKVSTMPEFLRHRYGEGSRKFLSYYAVFTTCVSLATTLLAGGILLSQMLGWPVLLCLASMMLVATSFTIVGGLEAVTKTDAIQSLLMIVVSAILTILGLIEVGGIGALIERTDSSTWNIIRPVDDAVYPWHAILLGYPVMAVWFFCTNQLIVQRALGAKDLDHAQKGCALAAYLKILTPLLFVFPGVLCAVLYPGLEDSDKAYATLVVNLMPVGMVGMVVAILMAALVSTINSQLNSLSTLITMDIYLKHCKTEPTLKRLTFFGRAIMAAGAILAVLVSYALTHVEGMDLFSLIQSIIAFMAPSMSVVFLAGVLWKRTTPTAAITVLIGGNILSVGVGICYLAKWPANIVWPHFLLLSFYIFAGLAVLIIIVSLITKPVPEDQRLPTLRESRNLCREFQSSNTWPYFTWGALSIIMLCLYLLFTGVLTK